MALRSLYTFFTHIFNEFLYTFFTHKSLSLLLFYISMCYIPAMNKQDVYEIITDKVIALLQAGTVPWQKPWKVANGQAPANFVSKKAYRGINAFLLLCASHECPFFVTFKQALELGGNVRKGEKGFPIVFWNFTNKKDAAPVNGKVPQVAFLRYYTVFNLEQCDGIKWEKPTQSEKTDFQALENAENIVKNMPLCPDIRHSGNRACYSPLLDFVNMPGKESFANAQGYYATLFHELCHATGHKSRLARKGIVQDESAISSFGSSDYSKEELVAEMGSSFLCGQAGILHATIDNSASYCAAWIARLKGDSKLIISAAGQAQKAADFILGESAGE